MLKFLLAPLLLLTVLSAPAQARHTQILRDGWRFTQGDHPGGQQPDFDDADWTRVSVPHDWSIAGPLARTNPTGQGGGYFPNGIGWYRLQLTGLGTLKNGHAFVVLDGVMANSDVWINGFLLGHRPNGTVSLLYDLTGHLNPGAHAHNTLAVRVDNSLQPASRWYEGAGIYRQVRLVTVGPAYLQAWSTVVTTPAATAQSATVHVATQALSATDMAATLQVNLLDAANHTVAHAVLPAQKLKANVSTPVAVDLTVTNPALWNLDTPSLYHAVVSLTAGGRTLDQDQQPFGIREFHFDPDHGFFLNGRNFKIKGAALHIDGSAMGDAVPAAVYEQRLRALKALGVNAIRTAHNPPSPQFLDLCDRLGMLVMEEMFDAWTVGKNPYDYHLYFKQWAVQDTRDTVRRDRNHPSIILWSAGNEIHDTPHPEIAIPILKSLVAAFHEEDPTRPVTQGLFRPNVSHDYDDGLADLLDVVGQNYREQELLAAHKQKPTRKIIGTENTHERSQWLAMRDHPEYSGQFLWTGVDYLGEAGEAGGWPIYANAAGLLDRTAYPRARAYERQSWWSDAPNIHAVRRIAPTDKVDTDPGYEVAAGRFKQVLFADWTPANTAAHTETVEVYTNCQQAELLLNGGSLGRQTLHADASPLLWQVPYAAGTLQVIGYDADKPVARDELRTAGKAAALSLQPERTQITWSDEDVVSVSATLRDVNGTMVPDSTTDVHFSLSGPGAIVAVDSGSNADHDSFQADHRRTFQGRNIVLVRAIGHAGGAITLTATAPGLPPVSVTLQVTAPAPELYPRSF